MNKILVGGKLTDDDRYAIDLMSKKTKKYTKEQLTEYWQSDENSPEIEEDLEKLYEAFR